MATDSQSTVQLPVRGQPNTKPTSSSKPTELYTLETIYSEALSEVETLHASGRLPEVYYDILTTTKTPMDLLSIVDEANEQRMGKQSQSKQALYSTVSSTVKRLDRYAGAIDMLAQSSPQAFGLNVVGLIWGSLKVLLVVAQDVIDTFEMVVQTLKDVESSLPIIETLTQIYGSSEIQLLRQPLIDIYKAIISLGLGVVRLCDQGSLRSLGQSTWTSLQAQFTTSVAELTRAAQLVQQAAQVEHMYATQKVQETVEIESRRQEHFRRGKLRVFATQLYFAERQCNQGWLETCERNIASHSLDTFLIHPVSVHGMVYVLTTYRNSAKLKAVCRAQSTKSSRTI